MSVVHWSLADRPRAGALRLRLRALALRLAALAGWGPRDRADPVIRVPPISTDWVRRYESRRRGDG